MAVGCSPLDNAAAIFLVCSCIDLNANPVLAFTAPPIVPIGIYPLV